MNAVSTPLPAPAMIGASTWEALMVRKAQLFIQSEVHECQ